MVSGFMVSGGKNIIIDGSSWVGIEFLICDGVE